MSPQYAKRVRRLRRRSQEPGADQGRINTRIDYLGQMADRFRDMKPQVMNPIRPMNDAQLPGGGSYLSLPGVDSSDVMTRPMWINGAQEEDWANTPSGSLDWDRLGDAIAGFKPTASAVAHYRPAYITGDLLDRFNAAIANRRR